jgi:hypothetical protein
MNRRQQLLVTALVLVSCGYLADQAYRRLYERPLENAERSVASLQKELHVGQLEARRQQKRLPQLDALHPRSLPRNMELAVTAYRSWLLRAIEQSGFEQANLDSGTPATFRNLYTRINFSLRTRGTLSQVTQLLHTFYRTDYLHQIRSLALTPTSDGTVDVSMAIEALSIPSLASSDRLVEPADVQRDGDPLDDYLVIARRNLFRPGEPPAANVKLSAITSDVSRQRQAWLNFLQTGETRRLSEGESLTLEGSLLHVEHIEPESVEFQLDGRRRRVRIGHTLEPK